MTCSIAQIKNKKIILGTDSQMTRGNHKDNEEKMLHYGELLHVFGSGNMADIHLFFGECVRLIREHGALDFTLVEEAYKGTVKVKKDFTTEVCDSTIFMCCDETLYVIFYDGFIQEYSRLDSMFIASGSGMEYAYGAYHAGASMRKCLEASAQYDVHTSAPFTIITV